MGILASRDIPCASEATSAFRLEPGALKDDNLSAHSDDGRLKRCRHEGHGGSRPQNLDDKTVPFPSEEIVAAEEVAAATKNGGPGSLLRKACDVHPPQFTEQVPTEQHCKILEEKDLILKRLDEEKQRCYEIIRRMEATQQTTLSLLRSVGFENVRTLARHFQQSQGQAMDLRKQVMEYQKKCMDLSSKIDQLEHLHSQRAMVESGSYQDSAATPPLLQTAADRVHDALAVCASEVFSRLKKGSNFNIVLLNIPLELRSPFNIKIALQALLCRIVFKGFGDPYFSLIDNLIPPFEIPSKRKSQLFQCFICCRDREAAQLLDEDYDFKLFVHTKAHDVCEEIKLQLLSTSCDADLDVLNRNEKNLHCKFLRLAKAAWVLHKLALAFEPSAELFYVGSGSTFDDMFMEDIAQDEDEEFDSMVQAKSYKKVKFMCVPGFIVRQTVIKSRVFCLPDMQPQECNMAKDGPTSMVVDDESPLEITS